MKSDARLRVLRAAVLAGAGFLVLWAMPTSTGTLPLVAFFAMLGYEPRCHAEAIRVYREVYGPRALRIAGFEHADRKEKSADGRTG